MKILLLVLFLIFVSCEEPIKLGNLGENCYPNSSCKVRKCENCTFPDLICSEDNVCIIPNGYFSGKCLSDNICYLSEGICIDNTCQ